jgi:gp16 family phage-associated protein
LSKLTQFNFIHKENIMTPKQVKAAFINKGVNVSEWAKAHGFTSNGVYRVLNGKADGRRGESYRISVALDIVKPLNGEEGEEHV